jgi:ketosteroid isomerase-like protein
VPIVTALIIALSAGVAPQELETIIGRSSAALFDAFNTCDLERFASLTADDLEFYHDRDGLITKQQVLQAVKNNICGKVRREPVSNTLEVHPIPNHGAVEAGTHRFYEVAPGKPDKLVGIAKFVHVWRQTDGGWKLSRVVSYDHKAAQAP